MTKKSPHPYVDSQHNRIAGRPPTFGDMEQINILKEESEMRKVIKDINSGKLKEEYLEYNKKINEYSCPSCDCFVQNMSEKDAFDMMTIYVDDGYFLCTGNTFKKCWQPLVLRK